MQELVTFKSNEKLDDCPKIKMILDKDPLNFRYAEAIRSGVCKV